MLSLFPRDVLDEIWDLIESVFDIYMGRFLKILNKTYFCQNVDLIRQFFYYLNVKIKTKLCLTFPQIF